MHKPYRSKINTYYGFQPPFCQTGMLTGEDLKRYQRQGVKQLGNNMDRNKRKLFCKHYFKEIFSE